MKRYILLSLVVLSLFSCEKSEFQLYESGNLLKFHNTNDILNTIVDSTAFSFALQADPTDKTYLYPVALKLSGVALSSEGKLKLSVNESSTAKEGIHFTKLPDTYSFKTGVYTDTIYIELLRDNLFVTVPDINNPGSTRDSLIDVRLALNVVDGGNFKVGIQEHNSFQIKFSDKVEKPSWWYLHNWYSFGDYSDTKYVVLLYVSNGDDLSAYDGWDPKLKQYTLDMMTYLGKVYAGEEENIFNISFDDLGNPLDENGNVIKPAPYI
jgi:hypothetical protein